MSQMPMPLFVCHANCCRSVLAYFLYGHLTGDATALSAGFEPGERINVGPWRCWRSGGWMGAGTGRSA